MSTIQKKDRTLEMTVDDLMSSHRLKIAVNYFNHCPELLRNILITLGESAQQATKSVIISEYNKFGSNKDKTYIGGNGERDTLRVSGLDQFEMTPYLRTIKEFPRYNTWWKISEGLERNIYVADPLHKFNSVQREQLMKSLRNPE